MRRRAVILPTVLFVLLLLGVFGAMYAFRINADLAATKAVAKKAVTNTAAVGQRAPAKGAARQPAERFISVGERRQMIAEAAYLRGESQGFRSDECEDWLYAEAQVDALLVRSKISVRD